MDAIGGTCVTIMISQAISKMSQDSNWQRLPYAILSYHLHPNPRYKARPQVNPCGGHNLRSVSQVCRSLYFGSGWSCDSLYFLCETFAFVSNLTQLAQTTVFLPSAFRPNDPTDPIDPNQLKVPVCADNGTGATLSFGEPFGLTLETI